MINFFFQLHTVHCKFPGSERKKKQTKISKEHFSGNTKTAYFSEQCCFFLSGVTNNEAENHIFFVC